MKAIAWIFRILVFCILLAFALNNTDRVTLHFLFGHAWTGPMVLILLAVFALGCVAGVLAMLPYVRKRRKLPPENPSSEVIETDPSAAMHL